MQEYTVKEIVEIVEGLPVLKIATGAAGPEVAAVADAYEGVLELVEAIPRKARYGVLLSAGLAVPAEEGAALYLPVANNCTVGRALSAGVRVSRSGDADFAVGRLTAQSGGALVTYFAARAAVVHAMSGRGDLSVALDAIPDPAENGAANTRRAAAPRTVAAPDAAGRPVADAVPEERDAEAAAEPEEDPRAEQAPSTLEIEGLADPMIARRFGVADPGAASLPESEALSVEAFEIPDLGTVRPDWRERVAGLVITDPAVRAEDGGRLYADASRFAAHAERRAERNLGYVPEAMINDLRHGRHTRAQARLTGEDRGLLADVWTSGAWPAHDLFALPGGGESVGRIVDASEARLLSVDGEVLLVPAGVSDEDPRLVGAAREAREGRLIDGRVGREDAERDRRRGARLLDEHIRWARRQRIRERGPAVAVSWLGAALANNAEEFSPAFRSASFLADVGRAAKERGMGGRHLDALRAAYRRAIQADKRGRRPLHPVTHPSGVPGPFNDPMGNRGDVASAYRKGLRGKAARLKGIGAPAEEVRFWRSFELKPNGDPKGAYAAPEVPFGGTPVRCDVLRFELGVEAEKVRLREKAPSGLLAQRITERPPVHARYGPGEAGNVVHVRALATWTVRTAVVFDPEGLYDAPELAADKDRRLAALLDAVARGRVTTAAEARTLARRLKERGEKAIPAKPDSWADRLPEAARESGPEPEGSFSKRGRDPFAAERHQGQEAVIATKSGRAFAPSRTPAQRERAARRLGATVAEAQAVAQETSRALDASVKDGRDRALAGHLASLPVAERLELFLALRGPVEISVLKDKSDDPTGVFLAACELRRAGRISVEGHKLSAPPLTAEAKRELEEQLDSRLTGPGEVDAPANAPAKAPANASASVA